MQGEEKRGRDSVTSGVRERSTGQLFGSIRREPEARMECERGAWGHETAQGRQLREANDAEHQHTPAAAARAIRDCCVCLIWRACRDGLGARVINLVVCVVCEEETQSGV
jgi:hypothetical protein